MKKEIIKSSEKLLVTYRVLMVVILVLVLLLVTGSLYAVIRPADAGPLFRIGGKGGSMQASANPGEATAEFSGIGSLRIPVSGSPSVTVILSISFPYPVNDRPFAEEIDSRIGEFRSIAIEYFSALPAEKIIRLDEESAKIEILRHYNSLLRLGQIKTLYFTDFNVID